MGHHGSVTRLIYDLRSDDSAARGVAARLIWQRYFHGLLELARSNLRQISLWRMEGCTNREIAERFACTDRAIERKLGRIRSLWTSFDDGVR